MSYESYLTDKEKIRPDLGTGTGSQNYKSGVGYAAFLRDSAYKSAEAATAEANRLADKQYKRTVIDSQSSYQKAIGAYGSNAEAVASRGLSGSGYGEWLQGNAYATHRGEVQKAGAQRLATQKDAAYQEQVAKQTADQDYGKFLYESDAAFNTGRDQTYTSLYNSAAEGATIDSIMQNGGWGDLTPEQQKAVTNAAAEYSRIKSEQENANTVQGMIDSGASVDEIKGSDAYIGLSATDRTSADKLITERDEKKKLAIDAAIEEAKDYSSLEDLNSYLVREMVPESERATVISGWQKKNVAELTSTINEATFQNGQLSTGGEAITGADLYAGIKAGLYGDNAETVIEAYVKRIMETVGSSSAGLKNTVWARQQLSDLANEWYKDTGETDKLQSTIGKNFENMGTVFTVNKIENIDGKPAKIDGAEFEFSKYLLSTSGDSELVGELQKLVGTRKRAIVYYKGSYYLYQQDQGNSRKWTRLKIKNS